MKSRLFFVVAIVLALPFSPAAIAGPQCMTQTVDAQGKGPTKPDALKSAICNWEKRVFSVDRTYADHTKAQNWTINYRQSGSSIAADVAGIPCQ